MLQLVDNDGVRPGSVQVEARKRAGATIVWDFTGKLTCAYNSNSAYMYNPTTVCTKLLCLQYYYHMYLTSVLFTEEIHLSFCED